MRANAQAPKRQSPTLGGALRLLDDASRFGSSGLDWRPTGSFEKMAQNPFTDLLSAYHASSPYRNAHAVRIGGGRLRQGGTRVETEML